MRAELSRREALRAMGLGTTGLLAGCQTLGRSAGAGRWYRGNLHMHSYWSDGRAFPEQAISMYKERGYDFIGLSDHNIFASDPNHYVLVEEKESGWPPTVSRRIFDAYVAEYGDAVETRQEGGKTLVRLKTYDEMRERFEEPGKFLLMPAVEITQSLDDVNVHLNYVNLPDVIPFLKGGPLGKAVDPAKWTVPELIRHNAAEVAAMSKAMRRPSMLMVNHPQWVYWDIKPQDLIDSPEVRFFEVCNGGSAFAPPAEAPNLSNDTFWDAVNAFRSLNGAPLLYGVGSDDTHHYLFLKPKQRLTDAWIMVRSTALTPEALLSAMDSGDYYATTGVYLEDVAFDARRRKLSVKVQAAPGVQYRIRFITTKRGFDQTVHMVERPAEKGRGDRTIPVYSEDIGRTVALVDGVKASYRMADDDLYVRARIESDVPSEDAPHYHPDVEVAWTQPYT